MKPVWWPRLAIAKKINFNLKVKVKKNQTQYQFHFDGTAMAEEESGGVYQIVYTFPFRFIDLNFCPESLISFLISVIQHHGNQCLQPIDWLILMHIK